MDEEEFALRKKSPIQIRNKKVSFEYFFADTYTADIVLTDAEIKPTRLDKASLVGAFCYIYYGGIWIRGMNISPYFYGFYSNPEAKHDRKLLLAKRGARKLEAGLEIVGHIIVPTLVLIDAYGRAKVDIASAKGKKGYDKRQTLREEEDRREADRAVKNFQMQRQKMQCGVIAVFAADDPSRLADFHDEICLRIILQDKMGEVSIG